LDEAEQQALCHDLCRNPPIPASIWRCRLLSFGYT
jgi:hypothetical protein